MIKGITFDNQNVTSQNDAVLHAEMFSNDGILFGCEYKLLPEAMNILAGYMLIGGRLIQFDGVTEIKFIDPVTAGYARIYLTIDLSKPALADDFQQVELWVDYNGSMDFPALKKEAINSGGVVYQTELAVITIEDKNAVSIKRRLSDLHIDAYTVDGKRPDKLSVNHAVSADLAKNAEKLNGKTESELVPSKVPAAVRADVATNAEKLNNQIASQMSVAKAVNADRAAVATNAEKLNNQVASQMSVNYATTAGNANQLIGKNWHWSGQNGQPSWLWGGSDGANMYVYNPSNFNVNYANSAGSANSATNANRAAVATNAERLNNQIASQMSVNYANSAGSTTQAKKLVGDYNGSMEWQAGGMCMLKCFALYVRNTGNRPAPVSAASFMTATSRSLERGKAVECSDALEKVIALKILEKASRNIDEEGGLVLDGDSLPKDVTVITAMPVQTDDVDEEGEVIYTEETVELIDLNALIALIAASVKELKAEKDKEIAALSKKLNSLEKRIAALEK